MLVGKLVILRELRESDLAYTHKWVNQRELKLLTGAYHPVSEVETQRWYERISLELEQNAYTFIIETIADNDVIGICSLANIDWIARKAELRIKIGEEAHWGQGAGGETIRLLVDFGFKDLNLHRIYLYVFSNNQRAVQTFEKCGFVGEGHLRDDAFLDGKYVDSLVMGVINDPGASSA